MSEASLRYFFEAARFGSMRAAAENLGVAVSSVSRQIAQLELDMGVSLIEHGRRNIKLTEAGELAVDYYRRRLGEKEDFESRLSDLKSLRTGKIGLAIDEGFAATAMSGVLAGFMTRFAGLSIDVHAMGPRQLASMVAEDEVHLGIGFGIPADPRLRVRAAVPAPLCLVMARGHALANRYRVQLADLADVRLVLPSGAVEIGARLKEAERETGIVLNTALTTNSLPLIKSLVGHGAFATILPAFAVAEEVESGAFVSVPLAEPQLQHGMEVALICRLGRQIPRSAARLMMALEAAMIGSLGREERLSAG